MDPGRCQKHESLLAGWCWMHLYFFPESQCKLDKLAVALSRHGWCTWGDAFYLPYWLWTKTTMDSGTQSSFSAWFAVQHFEQPSRGCKLLQFAWKIWSKVKRWIPFFLFRNVDDICVCEFVALYFMSRLRPSAHESVATFHASCSSASAARAHQKQQMHCMHMPYYKLTDRFFWY